MTEVAPYHGNAELAEQMEYARVVSSGAMLPVQYRNKPADILIAIGLGKAMGLSHAESLYRIHVINGRPTASAELVAANVRKAGHILRVRGDETSARAVIIRSDDPDFEFESVWNLDRARRLGLIDKDGWKKQPGTMMRWRAITEVARLACPEALYGVAYVADEITDDPREHTAPPVSADDFLLQTAQQQTQDNADVHDAEEVPDDQPEPKLTETQQKLMFRLFKAKGIPEHEQRGFLEHGLGRLVTSRTALTLDEFDRVHTHLESLPDKSVPRPTARDKAWAEFTTLAGKHERITDRDLRAMTEEGIGVPFDDVTAEQIQTTLANLKKRLGLDGEQ